MNEANKLSIEIGDGYYGAIISSVDDWFGHGIDHVSTFLSSIIIGLPKGTTGGGLFQLWIDYGFFSFLSFILFSFFELLKGKTNYLIYFFWLILVFAQGINTASLWFFCMLLVAFNQFRFQNSLGNVK